jgi:hypothetical protein
MENTDTNFSWGSTIPAEIDFAVNRIGTNSINYTQSFTSVIFPRTLGKAATKLS